MAANDRCAFPGAANRPTDHDGRLIPSGADPLASDMLTTLGREKAAAEHALAVYVRENARLRALLMGLVEAIECKLEPTYSSPTADYKLRAALAAAKEES